MIISKDAKEMKKRIVRSRKKMVAYFSTESARNVYKAACADFYFIINQMVKEGKEWWKIEKEKK